LEKKFCKEIVLKRNLVISTGGKTLLEKENLRVFSSWGVVITLLSSPDEILKRIQKGGNLRPLLASHQSDEFYRIFRKREPHYLNLPNKIDTTFLSKEEVVEEILKLIKGQCMNPGEKESSMIVKKGSADDIGSCLKDIIKEKRVFVLSDKKVFGIHGEKLLDELKLAHLKSSVFLLNPGERQKNLKTAERLYCWLLDEKATRSSVLVSFGGGVVSDLGGYAASTFHRGLKLVNIPTTLLAQIDASIGGKNGINLKAAKNQIGTFYFPSFILIDPLFLVSLDPRYMKEGIVEALKAGIIADQELFQIIKKNASQLLLKDMKLLEEVIKRAMEVKMNIVHQDPFEKGIRRILNLGHTFGHALESYFGYGKITHGQAVGLGMICASKMGMLMNITTENILYEIKEILKVMKMPLYLENLDISKILSLMEFDKKRKEERISFIIPKRIGEVVTRRDVSKNIIIGSLKEISHG
jgi:3-dehydroquinate synthase